MRRAIPSALLLLLQLASAGGERDGAAVGQSLLQRSHRQDLSGSSSKSSKSQLQVAIAVLATQGFLDTPDWRDAFAVAAFAAQKAANLSRHNTTLLALLPDTLTTPEKDAFASLGYQPRAFPLPVRLDEVESQFGREEMAKGCCGEVENLKYYGANLTDFDYVLVLDVDVMLLKSLDDLLENETVINSALSATYDHELDVPGSRFPPIQGGYLLFKSSPSDFDALMALTRQGDFRPGTGWKGTGVGWAYGGAGPVGLLSFYYNMVVDGRLEGPFTESFPQKGTDLPGQMTEQPPGTRLAVLDRSRHDVLDTKALADALRDGKVHVDDVASFHFAGQCLKPWTCSRQRSDICREMTTKWWEFRAEFAASRGIDAGPRCESAYGPLDL